MDLSGITPSQLEDAVEIASRTYWVGHYVPGDDFQCHVYLIENGDNSVLIDPGSLVTYEHTYRKIQQIMPIERIRYFICHHQDPDIAGAMHRLDPLVRRKDARVITHWRSKTLLRHMALDMTYWLVDEHEWALELDDRTLRFIFTPYLHFPGAFCTYDEKTKVLFSSDLFGGFTEDWSLLAKDESYFECIRPFHEHYMPGKEILAHGLSRLEPLDIDLIAPQHGSLIPHRFVSYMIEKLKGLECGLYLMSVNDTDIRRLLRVNTMLREALKTMVLYRDFSDTARSLREIMNDMLPVSMLSFYLRDTDGQTILLSPESGFRGVVIEEPEWCRDLLDAGPTTAEPRKLVRMFHDHIRCGVECSDQHILIDLNLPGDDATVRACAALCLEHPIELTEEMEDVLTRLAVPLAVAVERDALLRRVERERQLAYERSVHDPLTGLYNRQYMQGTLPRFMEVHDRDPADAIGVILFDIEQFKSVNDTYGHGVGDIVLKRIADVIREHSRRADIPVRIGGEEFAVFVVGTREAYHQDVAERVRSAVEQLVFNAQMQRRRVTLSAGTAIRRQGEELEAFVARADMALYRAKRTGRNRVEHAE